MILICLPCCFSAFGSRRDDGGRRAFGTGFRRDYDDNQSSGDRYGGRDRYGGGDREDRYERRDERREESGEGSEERGERNLAFFPVIMS